MPFLTTEKTTSLYQVTLKDQAGVAITQARCSTFKVSLFNMDDDARTIINSRNAQDQVAGGWALGITIDSNGVVSFKMSPGDNAVIGTRGYERHGLEYDVTLTGGERLVWEDEIRVQNQDIVT